MAEWVLDASAVLAMMRGEPGDQRVCDALATALLSSVNAAEVVTRLIREGMEPADARDATRRIECPIVSVDAELALRAGTLSRLTAQRGLSLGDRICLALAERERAVALTADRAWVDLRLPIGVALIR